MYMLYMLAICGTFHTDVISTLANHVHAHSGIVYLTKKNVYSTHIWVWANTQTHTRTNPYTSIQPTKCELSILNT